MTSKYMKDVADYGKYGLLRFFAQQGIRIGINGYLSAEDSIKKTEDLTYLEEKKFKKFDEVLFDFLREVVQGQQCAIRCMEEAGLLQGASFYHQRLDQEHRDLWHEEALNQLKGADIIFLDAEKGMVDNERGAKDADKYIRPSEAVDYYNRGQNIIYYSHKGRHTYGEWDDIRKQIVQYLPEAKLCVMTYQRGQKHSYIFVIHPEEYKKYMELIYRFQYSRWGRVFKEEFIGGKNPAMEQVGHSFVVPLSGCVDMSIKLQQDGRVCIQFSDQANMSTIMSADNFARYFRR